MAEHEELIRRAEALGIPTNSGMYMPRNEAVDELAITDYELHRRIREEERHRREHRLWIVAVVSAVIAFLSAIGAWLAIIVNNG